jgi:DMSO/TMAO reductase YedYZ heme-binding membrane subunit
VIALLGNEQLTWYITRASGITAWFLSAAAVLWGLFLSTGVLRGKPRRPWLLDLHRFIGGLTVVFTVVHLAAQIGDNFVNFKLVDVLVPMAAQWQPGAVAWGVVAFWLLIAVEITSLLRRTFVPERIWRAVHASSFLLFGFGTVHLLQAGTDAENPFLFWPVVVVCGAVLFLSWWRVLVGRSTGNRTSLAPTPRTPDDAMASAR